MKKNTFIKRLFVSLMTIAMTLGMSVSAFAAEPVSEPTVAEVHDARLNNNLSALITNLGSGQSGKEEAYLDSYIGVAKTFRVKLLGSVGSGNVSVYVVRKSDGKDIGSWTLNSSRPEGSVTVALPTSGNYKMVVYNGTNSSISVLGYWE